METTGIVAKHESSTLKLFISARPRETLQAGVSHKVGRAGVMKRGKRKKKDVLQSGSGLE